MSSQTCSFADRTGHSPRWLRQSWRGASGKSNSFSGPRTSDVQWCCCSACLYQTFRLVSRCCLLMLCCVMFCPSDEKIRCLRQGWWWRAQCMVLMGSRSQVDAAAGQRVMVQDVGRCFVGLGPRLVSTVHAAFDPCHP